MKHSIKLAAAASLVALLAACGGDKAADADATAEKKDVTVEDAKAFIDGINEHAYEVNGPYAKTYWLASTYINPDTQLLASRVGEESLKYSARIVEESKQFNELDLQGETARAMKLVQIGATMPSPSEDAKIAELAQLSTELEAMYGAGKWCPEDEDGKCYSLGDLENIIDDPAASYDEKLRAWAGWRTVSPPMKEKYVRFVELMNEGANELGFKDTGALWRSGYDMPADEFTQVTEDLWADVKPLYDSLHCYVRDELQQQYGEEKVPSDGPIPAHLLGNMWSQEWGNVYPIVEPYQGLASIDVSAELESRRADKEAELKAKLGDEASIKELAEAEYQADEWIALEMVKSAENFYKSMGMGELPESFWERSQFVKPRDRDVVCHASAWDMDMKGDVRIKMCIEPNLEDLKTVYHELGHLYYDLAYNVQDPIFQSGAHDGFHEAIGDTIELAMTPEYLASQGLIESAASSEEAVINNQMKMALNKVAFLPFGKLIDQWRWKVFAGDITPEDYNTGWWKLRTEYQGIEAPVERGADAFDPGAKYHIPGNTPYTRYFLARILQFQFYDALCDAAGHEGPLYQCSFFGSEEAGKRFNAMMANGQSQPWQDTMAELTGTREMSGEPLLEYFAPLKAWLDTQNEGKSCGW
ncbi:MAG: M2 family metallopeptidase [Gammaproteobacteria bacterium]|nr:M2 family metallopeptidase [Gammaproteobacteria bacterium]